MAGEKEYDYVVTVKKQGQATFTAISILLIIIGVAANLFFYFVINNNSTLFGSFGNSFFQQDWLVPFLIPVAIFLTALELYRQKRGNYIASFGWPLSLCGIAFIIGPTHTFLFAARPPLALRGGERGVRLLNKVLSVQECDATMLNLYSKAKYIKTLNP